MSEAKVSTKHNGDLVIRTPEKAKRYAHIVEVTGSLYVSADFKAPLLATVGGSIYVSADFQAPQLATAHGKPGRLLAVSEYGLWLAADGLYYAGCRGPLTKEQALAHWDRQDERAIIFTAAIRGTR